MEGKEADREVSPPILNREKEQPDSTSPIFFSRLFSATLSASITQTLVSPPARGEALGIPASLP
jgi:hypothetical protein